jgi:hypothetical protein
MHFGTFLVQKLELLTCMTHFRGRSYFGDLGSINFWNQFGTLNDHFWGQSFVENYIALRHCSTNREISIDIDIASIGFHTRKLCPHKLTYAFDHHGTKWMPSQWPLLTHVELVTCRLPRRF